MIKLNLLDKKKTAAVSSLPFNLTTESLNIKGLIISFVVYLLVSYIITPGLNSEVDTVSERISKINGEIAKIQAEIDSQAELKEQLLSYNDQITALQEKTKVVQKILETRRNPRSLLERIARTIPDDVWLTSLSINQNADIKIEGESLFYKSIGEFIASANDSVFFGKTLKLAFATTDTNRDGGKKRVEKFKIEGTVQNFG